MMFCLIFFKKKKGGGCKLEVLFAIIATDTFNGIKRIKDCLESASQIKGFKEFCYKNNRGLV
jgi:hypothetical protein